MSLQKEPWEVATMRQSGRRLAEVLRLTQEAAKPGVTTLELDAIAEKAIRGRNAIPSFLNYKVGSAIYRHSICASVNEQVVHGIPNDKPLRDGDILSLDIGLIYGGYHADSAITIPIGTATPEALALIEATRKGLEFGIAAARIGNKIGDIGFAVQSYCEKLGYGVVRDFVGHGIGRAMHEKPSVPNYGAKGQGQVLKPGMCLAIEPMITLGNPGTRVLRDAWTVVTLDGKISAHFEHTVVVTEKGPEILTVLDPVPAQAAAPPP
jgi:methionyl aminopeptidase